MYLTLTSRHSIRSITAAKHGCEYHTAIYAEFRSLNLLKEIFKKEDFKLDTNVSICIGFSNYESQHQDQIYRILSRLVLPGMNHYASVMKPALEKL